MSDSNTSAPAETAEPSVNDIISQLVTERTQQDKPKEAPATQATQADDEPDPADLEALEASETELDPTATEKEQPAKVRLPDGTEATFEELQEWRKGQLRQADYTKKTQELAEHRKQFETQLGQFQQHSQTQAQAVEQAIALVSHFMPKPPSDELRKQDFFAWQEQKAEYDSQVGKLQGLMQQRGQLQAAEQQKRAQAQQEHVVKQQETLFAAKPELKDPVKAMKFWEDVKQVGANLGFTPAEMAQISDSRVLLLADKAIKYDRLMAHKVKLAEKSKNAEPMAALVQAPQRRVSPAERAGAEVEKAKNRFDKSGDLRDLANVLVTERAARR